MKTVVEMARHAGLLVIGTADGGEAVYTWPKGITDELKRFATLVATAEREAIAQSLDRQADLACDSMDRVWAQEMAAAVRARGEQK